MQNNKYNRKKYKRLYKTYHSMKRRCYNDREKRYKDYGGRGIKICDEWLQSFDNFAEWALNNGYADNLTIDRINVDGNYEPSNCRWITLKEQRRNCRNTRWVEYNGEKIQLFTLCERLGLSYDTTHDRIYKRGWELERALTEPSQLVTSFAKKCREHGINPITAKDRIVKLGWTEEEALNTPTKGRGANQTTYNRSNK